MSEIALNLAMADQIEFLPMNGKKHDYCVISGVLNEGQRFSEQLERMQQLRSFADIIIVDGGSTDGATSPERLQDKVTALIIDKRRKGLSGQYQSALAYALDQGYLGAVMVDGNGKDGVEAVSTFISALKNGADFIQGSRFLPGGEHFNTPIIRHFAIKLIFCPVINYFSGFHYTDAINGFKGVSRKLLEDEGMQIFRDVFTSYSLQYYLNYRAPRINAKVMEVAVRRNYPSRASFPTKIHGLKGYVNVLKLLFKTCLGKYNPA